MLADLIEFCTIFQQDDFVAILKLPKDMLMSEAAENILHQLGLSTRRLLAAELSLMYKSLEGCDHVVVQPKRTLSSYLGDYGDGAKSTQDTHSTLYVSLYHKDKQVEHQLYSPTVVMTSHFRVVLEDLPSEIPVNIMHNDTGYTQSDSFRPTEAGSVTAHYIVDHIISQANEPHGQDPTDENVVLYSERNGSNDQGSPHSLLLPHVWTESGDEDGRFDPRNIFYRS